MASQRPNPNAGAAKPAPTGPVPRRKAPEIPGLPSIIRATSSANRAAQSPLASQSSSSKPISKPAQLASALPTHVISTFANATSSSQAVGKGTPARASKQSLPARSSKTTQKLVLLPEEPQTAPLPNTLSGATGAEGGENAPPRKDTPSVYGDDRTEAEKMSKEQREADGYPRLTAYATADGYRLKKLAAFLKREHGAEVRIYDEALFAVYTLPLCPGYGAHVKVRSSPAVKSPGGGSILNRMDVAEETGYTDSYFAFEPQPMEPDPNANPADDPNNLTNNSDIISAFLPSDIEVGPPSPSKRPHAVIDWSDMDAIPTITEEGETSLTEEQEVLIPNQSYIMPLPEIEPLPTGFSPPVTEVPASTSAQRRRMSNGSKEPKVAEAVFFDYGVSVFFGFPEGESSERDILEDCEMAADCWVGAKVKDDWELEECHFMYDPDIAYPRIFNDLFTFKSPSHLLKLSLSHALAQSTKLSLYEANVQNALEASAYIPKELALSGELKLDRIEALKLTGRLFRLRVDVNLVSNVLDVPELFWSEASLKLLYDAVREYLEIDGRISVLNERLAVAGDMLEIVHDHVDNAGMHRVTWIIIWLIVMACVVEMGEVGARLAFHGMNPGVRKTGEIALVKGIKMMAGLD